VVHLDRMIIAIECGAKPTHRAKASRSR
jgi:hypothetical protein